MQYPRFGDSTLILLNKEGLESDARAVHEKLLKEHWPQPLTRVTFYWGFEIKNTTH